MKRMILVVMVTMAMWGCGDDGTGSEEGGTGGDAIERMAVCGDGIVSPGEQCEPGRPVRWTCGNFGYSGGYVICTDECTVQLFCHTMDGSEPHEGYHEPQEGVVVAAGDNETCFAPGNGRVWCWGEHAGFAAKDETGKTHPSGPTLLEGEYPRPVDLCISSGVGCLVGEDGSVWCWGRNESGQLGQGSTDPVVHTEPVKVPGVDLGPVDDLVHRSVVCASDRVCALSWRGELWCWGGNTNGVLGIGSDEMVVPSPVRMAEDVMAVDLTLHNGCLVSMDTSVKCWGNDGASILGQGGFPQYNMWASTPIPVLDSEGGTFDGAIDVAVSDTHACALMENGEIWCWGMSDFDQLGHITRWDHASSPVPVDGGRRDPYKGFIDVDLMRHTSLAIADWGMVNAWGQRSRGSLGDGMDDTVVTNISTVVPAIVVLEDYTKHLTGVAAIAAGHDHACALRYDGTLWCWGENMYRQLGLSSQVEYSSHATLVDHEW